MGSPTNESSLKIGLNVSTEQEDKPEGVTRVKPRDSEGRII